MQEQKRKMQADSGAGGELTVRLPDADATAALGARLAPMLRAGDVVALWGDLGLGKTTLVRGLVRAAVGGNVDVPSPTFTLVQTYELPRCSLWHFDLYRLERPEDAWELGVEEAFVEAASMIEWPDRLGPLLPRDRLDILLEAAGGGRIARLSGSAAWTDRLEVLADG